MRVLILSCLLACAAAAPSVGLVPTVYTAPIAAAIPVAAPTIPPGDIQAAAIDAQVKAEDTARAFADQARELAEQAAENQNAGVAEANDLAKEKSEEAFWNSEEQKWQALDALKTAEAQIDAVAASNSPVVARSAYIPYVTSAVVAGIPAGIPAVIPGYQALPAVIAKAIEIPAAAAPEAPKAEDKEAAVKAAEPEQPAEAEKPVEAEAEKAADSVQVESADLKAAAPEPEKIDNLNPFIIQSFAQTHPVAPIPAVYAAPLSIAPLAYSQPLVAPLAYVQGGLKAVATSAIHQVQGQFIAPTVVKTQW